MELLWLSEPSDPKKNTIRQKWKESSIDTAPASISNGIFHSSPFALGMSEDPSVQQDAHNAYPGATEGGENSKDGDITSLKLGERGIINPLWQYNELADPRTCGKAGVNYGRVYNKRIRPNNPIVFIQPGRPTFFGIDKFLLGGADKATQLREAVVDNMNLAKDNDVAGDTFSISAFIEELAEDTTATDGGVMKFYDFQPDFSRYKAYVQKLLTELMIRMHIIQPGANEAGYFGTTTDYFTQFMYYYGWGEQNRGAWGSDGSTSIQSAFLPFRVEKTTDAGDSFTNSTGNSTVAEKLKGISDNAKEVAFLTNASKDGKFSLSDVAAFTQQTVGATSGALSGTTESIIRTGGNLLFPEIWKESTYSHNITINIKLHAPDGDPQCYFANILFPVACLLGLIMPRQVGMAVYGSPPLVRCYSKGWFSCDMGIVESISIRRGSDTNDWTVGRLARTVEISMTIKDLFPTLIMSLASRKGVFHLFHNRNTPLRDYLNVLGGVDAFSSTLFSSRVKNMLQQNMFEIQKFFDPRTWAAGLAMNPVMAIPAKISQFMKGWF
jgi:hypothetical protein